MNKIPASRVISKSGLNLIYHKTGNMYGDSCVWQIFTSLILFGLLILGLVNLLSI